jgi:pimeloyl-ACP methyl ester carboxylesterase
VLWQRIRRLWIAAGVLVTVVFVAWSLIAYRSSADARAAAESGAGVNVNEEDGVWRFASALPASSPLPALVFFPGALVDPRAYAPLARAVALAGFPAFLIELPRRGAFGGDADPEVDSRLASVLRVLGENARIALAGHSLGAVVAARLAARAFPQLGGLIVIGSSHPRDVDLSSLQIPVTKIVGTRDGLASPADVRRNAPKLPATTRWVWVEGGNHSQFGWYGLQPGDWPATIDASQQRQIMIDGVIDTLRQLTTTP